MPVIIHDFEITVEPPEKKAKQDTATPESHDATPALRPEDIVRIERHFRERQKRLHAD